MHAILLVEFVSFDREIIISLAECENAKTADAVGSTVKQSPDALGLIENANENSNPETSAETQSQKRASYDLVASSKAALNDIKVFLISRT